DDALLRLVAMIVPGPTRRQYEISRLHIDTLAIDGGIGAASFNDKADRRRAVAVRARHFTRQEAVHSGHESVCRLPTLAAGGGHKAERPGAPRPGAPPSRTHRRSA